MQRSHKTDGVQRTKRMQRAQVDTSWSLLTPHALVLLCISRTPNARMREIAEHVGISERGAHQIVADLVNAKYVQRTRVGRCNVYAIEDRTQLRHDPVRHRRVASIVALLEPEPAGKLTTTRRSARSSRTDVTRNGSRRRAA